MRVGTAANEVPTNGMLGEMAFQDPRAVVIEGGLIGGKAVENLVDQQALTAARFSDPYSTIPTLDLSFVGGLQAAVARERFTRAQVLSGFSNIVTFTRASGGGRFNAQGQYEWLPANEPRIDYDPVTGECRGLLIEESRTNLLLRSGEFDNAAWGVKDRITFAADAGISPDGTLTADRLVEDTTATSTHRIGAPVSGLISEGTYTVSFYVKAAGRTSVYIQDGGGVGTNYRTIFNMVDLTVLKSSHASHVSALITKARNDWFRVSLTYKVPIGVTTITFLLGLASGGTGDYTGDGTSGIYVWGAQLEAGAFPTSYIPTTNAQVTRAADVAVVNELSPWYNASEGSLFVDYVSGPAGSGVVAQLDDGTQNNRTEITTSAGAIRLINATGGTQDAAIFITSPPAANTPYKVASAMKLDDFAAVANVGQVGSDTSVSLSAKTRLLFGSRAGLFAINGHIRSIRYFPRALTSEELQEITA